MITSRQRRRARHAEPPIVGSLPNCPAILAVRMNPQPPALALRAHADVLLVQPDPGAMQKYDERESIATVLSTGNAERVGGFSRAGADMSSEMAATQIGSRAG